MAIVSISYDDTVFTKDLGTSENEQSDSQTGCDQANSAARLPKPLYSGVNLKVSTTQIPHCTAKPCVCTTTAGTLGSTWTLKSVCTLWWIVTTDSLGNKSTVSLHFRLQRMFPVETQTSIITGHSVKMSFSNHLYYFTPDLSLSRLLEWDYWVTKSDLMCT